MKFKLYINWSIVLMVSLFSISCEDFVEIDAPNNKLIREEVFNNEQTAISSMTGIYNQLFMANFSNGSTRSVTFLSGLSADNITNISTNNLIRMEFQQNELQPNNSDNLSLWSSAYNIVYLANALIEGLTNSNAINADLSAHLEGEAKFVRAFTYFYLVNLYGEVPLLLTTNYRNNELASRDSQEKVYSQIIDDLQSATELLGSNYERGERTQVNKYVATAMLARVYLYLEDWEMAENLSSEVIAQNYTYEILEDLNKVFLANSREAIWQISPVGRGSINTHTNEGNIFIHNPILPFFISNELDDDLIIAFDDQDKRLSQWIGFNQSRNSHYGYKYKIWNSSEQPISEYSMVLRLAEQYLIRAEARAEQGNFLRAIEDLDIIRKRAGIEQISEINPNINREELLEKIYGERRRELFAEWGHRWFDLKRTGRAGEVLGVDNPHWDATDVLYPIPEEERKKNPNLSQNSGY